MASITLFACIVYALVPGTFSAPTELTTTVPDLRPKLDKAGGMTNDSNRNTSTSQSATDRDQWEAGRALNAPGPTARTVPPAPASTHGPGPPSHDEPVINVSPAENESSAEETTKHSLNAVAGKIRNLSEAKAAITNRINSEPDIGRASNSSQYPGSEEGAYYDDVSGKNESYARINEYDTKSRDSDIYSLAETQMRNDSMHDHTLEPGSIIMTTTPGSLGVNDLLGRPSELANSGEEKEATPEISEPARSDWDVVVAVPEMKTTLAKVVIEKKISDDEQTEKEQTGKFVNQWVRGDEGMRARVEDEQKYEKTFMVKGTD